MHRFARAALLILVWCPIALVAEAAQAQDTVPPDTEVRASFENAEREREQFERFEIRVEIGSTDRDEIRRAITAQIDDAMRRARQVADAYGRVAEHDRPRWTIDAGVQQGRTFDHLADAIARASLSPSLDPTRVSPEAIQRAEAALRAVLERHAQRIRCLAVARYVRMARAADAGHVDDEYVRYARERLDAIGPEFVAQCPAH